MPLGPLPRILPLVGLLALAGCTKVHTAGRLPLAMAQMSPQSVGLEAFTARFELGEGELNGPVWNEIDEQHIPIELRRRLQDNGLRVGLVGGRLPAALEELLRVDQADMPGADGTAVDLTGEPPIRGKLLQSPPGVPKRIIVSGEQQPHEELVVLERNDQGRVAGRSFALARGVIVATTWPQADGRVRLDLVPELEHGEPKRRIIPHDGYARFEFGPDAEVFDHLRIETLLAPGQTLVMGTFPDQPGTLGYQYFTEQLGGALEQKLLFIRLARTQHDELSMLEAQPSGDKSRAEQPGDLP